MSKTRLIVGTILASAASVLAVPAWATAETVAPPLGPAASMPEGLPLAFVTAAAVMLVGVAAWRTRRAR